MALQGLTAVRNFIAGAPAVGRGRDVISVVDPSTGEQLTEFRAASAEDVDDAVRAARGAGAAWAARTPGSRSELLHRVVARVEEHLDELAELEMTDAGKPWTAVRNMELPGIVAAMRYFAGAGTTPGGQPAGDYVAGHTSLVRREPLGVVAGITPWNYPLWQAVWKIAPALVTGNTVVIKPAEITPLSTTRFAELSADLLPPGVLNVVHGRGPDVGEALVSHPDVDMVTFTGSTRAGQRIASLAAGGPKRTVMELGGNSPVVVFDDVDLEAAIPVLTEGITYNCGQECMAATRLIVADRLHDNLVHALVTALKAVTVGDVTDKDTSMGPLISEAHLEKVLGLLERRPGRASALTGGRRIDRPGFYVEPTLVTGLEQDDELIQTEIFGPVATVQRFDTEEEAIHLANSVPQGLAASVWTEQSSRSLRVANALEFGVVWVNTHMIVGPELPIGGFRASGYGKEGGAAGMEEFTRVKQVVMSHG